MTAPVLDLAVLKSWDFGQSRATSDGKLPYRMDHLEQLGIRLHWTDRLLETAWLGSRSGRLIRSIESATVPFAQTVMLAPVIRRCAATLAFFESEANFLAVLRRLSRREVRTPFVVMTSWLSEVLSNAGRVRRYEYRWAYRSVDVVYYFSRNQGTILQQALGLPPERLRYLPFGVDTETFTPTGAPDEEYVLAVGRDRARDWPTLFEAVGSLDASVKVCCRPSQIRGLEVPENVELLGYVDRDRYRKLLGSAKVVAVLTKPVRYPSGQSVLLEAMAMGRTVVVTNTPSISDYIRDGVDCIAVPPGDPAAVRRAIEEAAADDALRGRIGANARRVVEERYNCATMWGSVARDLFELTGR